MEDRLLLCICYKVTVVTVLPDSVVVPCIPVIFQHVANADQTQIILFYYHHMMCLSRLSGYLKLKLGQMVPLRDIKLVLLPEDFSKLKVAIMMRHLLTVRTLIVVASTSSWTISQMDVKKAFLHGDLHEEVYKQPP
jgi:hypothetical protein